MYEETETRYRDLKNQYDILVCLGDFINDLML